MDFHISNISNDYESYLITAFGKAFGIIFPRRGYLSTFLRFKLFFSSFSIKVRCEEEVSETTGHFPLFRVISLLQLCFFSFMF